MAVYSSYKRKSPWTGTVAVGEIGLTGDLRAVQNGEKILKEASRLGFDRVVVPGEKCRETEKGRGGDKRQKTGGWDSGDTVDRDKEYRGNTAFVLT